MNVSLQTKLLLMCITLILMTTMGISSTYYFLTKADKHQESRQRIQIAFDIVFDGLHDLQGTHMSRVSEFLKSNAKIASIGSMYGQGQKILQDPQLINAYITSTSTEMKNFSRLIQANTLAFYALDKRLLLIYQQSQQDDMIGAYVLSATGQDTFLILDDPTSQEMLSMWMGKTPIPDAPLPPSIRPSYDSEIPATISSELFSEGQTLGIRVSAPVTYLDQTVGILVSEFVFTQSLAERYASLSQTAMNLFAGNQWNIGTLAAQAQLEIEVLERLASCETIVSGGQDYLQVVPVILEEQHYYQGACTLMNTRGTIGAITVSLSQEIEKQAIRKIAIAMMIVAGIIIAIAVGVSVLFSRKAARFIQQLLAYISRIAEGDISEQLSGTYTGEFDEIQQKLNLMGEQLKDVIVTAKTLADHVAMSSDSLNRRAEEMSQGATQQAAASEEASASMEQMTANIRQNADNARLTERAALQSAEYAEEGAQVVTETVMTMQQIAQKIAVIGDIARQTRLLSLNATIEAARAQEHGKAFSIVASEVRQLSDVARQAAEEINELAASSLDVSEKAGDMLNTLVPGIHNTAELVQEITAASNEQSTGATQINNAIQQLEQITQQNSAISQEIATTAEELATQAQHLQRTIEFFTIGETAPEASLHDIPRIH